MKLPQITRSVLEIATHGSATVTMLGGPESPPETRTHVDLAESAARWATRLAGSGIGHGDRVGVFTRTSFDFITVAFALWRVGAVVVSLPGRPRLATDAAWAEATRIKLERSRARALICCEGDPAFELGVDRIEVGTLDGAAPFTDMGPAPEDEALIQFTSGSTSAGKGVVLDHGAISASMRRHLSVAGPFEDDERFFTWLPLSHDLGLITYMLRPLTEGHPIVFLPTEVFVRDPLTWLVEMDRCRCTMSSAPNFAFGLVARELAKRPLSVDLSRWRYASSGGETIDRRTVERFTAATARHGFDPAAFVAGYGLAEATCTVSIRAPGSGMLSDRVDRADLARGKATPSDRSEGSAEFVSVGRVLPGLELRIVAADGRPQGDRVVGEITLRGPGVMRGYAGEDAATADALRDGWLHTGDLGYRADDELFITGRIKDVIVVNGENYLAEDIESVVATVPGVRAGNCVAIPIAVEGSEAIGILAESRLLGADAARCRDLIVETMVRETGLAPAVVRILPPRSVPKTSSGKLARYRARKMLEEGVFDEGHETIRPRPTPPDDATTHALMRIWETVLERPHIAPDDDFFDLGGTSIQAARIVGAIEDRFGRSLPLSVLVTAPTITKLARAIERHEGSDSPTLVHLAGDGTDKAELFLVHGGMRLRALARHLDQRHSTYGFQAKGADARTPPHASVKEMAYHYVASLRSSAQPPYRLLGFSFGGVVAHEMAVQLQASGQEVEFLGIIDADAPGQKEPTSYGPFGTMKTTAGIGLFLVLGWLRLRFGRPSSMHVYNRYMLAHFRRLTRKHRPRRFLGTMTYFRVVDPAGLPRRGDPSRWESIADRIEVRDVEGPSHQGVVDEPWVRDLARAIDSAIRGATASRSGEPTA